MDSEKIIAVVNKINELDKIAGAFKMFFFCGDTDDMFKIFDYLVSIGYIERITEKGTVKGQDEIYVKNHGYIFKG